MLLRSLLSPRENDSTPIGRHIVRTTYLDKGFHRILYRFSPDDYRQIREIWNGMSAIDGSEREVEDGPSEGGEVPDLESSPPLHAPQVSPEDVEEIAKRL